MQGGVKKCFSGNLERSLSLILGALAIIRPPALGMTTLNQKEATTLLCFFIALGEMPRVRIRCATACRRLRLRHLAAVPPSAGIACAVLIASEPPIQSGNGYLFVSSTTVPA